jgi:hypothetical protein
MTHDEMVDAIELVRLLKKLLSGGTGYHVQVLEPFKIDSLSSDPTGHLLDVTIVDEADHPVYKRLSGAVNAMYRGEYVNDVPGALALLAAPIDDMPKYVDAGGWKGPIALVRMKKGC